MTNFQEDYDEAVEHHEKCKEDFETKRKAHEIAKERRKKAKERGVSAKELADLDGKELTACKEELDAEWAMNDAKEDMNLAEEALKNAKDIKKRCKKTLKQWCEGRLGSECEISGSRRKQESLGRYSGHQVTMARMMSAIGAGEIGSGGGTVGGQSARRLVIDEGECGPFWRAPCFFFELSGRGQLAVRSGAFRGGGGTDVCLNGPAPASLDAKAHCIFGLPVFNVDRKNKVPY